MTVMKILMAIEMACGVGAVYFAMKAQFEKSL